MTPKPIRATGVALMAVCELRLPDVCMTADGTPKPITAVFDSDGLQHNVCSACLTQMIRAGTWVERGHRFEPVVGSHSK